MNDEYSGNNSTSKKLRQAGYVPIPRWWVKPEDIEVIRRIISHHGSDISKIREDAKLAREMEDYYK